MGGISGYLAIKAIGVLAQKYNTTLLSVISTAIFIVSIALLTFDFHNAYLFIILYLGSTYARLVASSALSIRFPTDEHRAGFGTLQTAMTYLATTVAFFLSSLLLPVQEVTRHNLTILLTLSSLSAVVLSFFMRYLQMKLI